MDKEEIARRVLERLEDCDEYFGSEQDDSSYDREYFYGIHDAYVWVLNLLGVEHNKEYFN